MSHAPRVRFDSLDPARGPRSCTFDGLRAVLRADTLADVLPVMRAAEEAVAAGLHAAGFVAYEAAPAFDPALAATPRDPHLPLAWFGVYEQRVECAAVPPPAEDDEPFALGAFTADVDERAYAAGIARIREWIAAGDTYQVNYTLRLRAPFSGAAAALYRRLCHAQRAAFCAHLEIGGGISILSASPELFFRREGGELELRPMKGTRPRGRWLAEDRAIAAELARAPKDRAENLMIVDLLRNDAGRLAEFGSVRVERMFEVERYETVHQMTSTIRARTRPGAGLADIFRALFPCGSVTGAPKVRTSQIIAELEPAPRGVYTGAIGFASPGHATFSVAIRTMVVDHARGQAELGVGSGVTHDSLADAEHRECLSKAAFAHRDPNPPLLETLRWEPRAGYLRLHAHLARLAGSAEYFGYPLDVRALLLRLEMLSVELPREPRRVRIVLDPGGTVEIEHAEAPAWNEPVRMAVARRHVPASEPLLYHKHARRALYLRRDAVDVGQDVTLAVNERGELAETEIANVVLEMQGRLWTPPVNAGLLPGILRAELIREGRITERTLDVDDLRHADAVWVVNSLRGWGRAELVEMV